MSIWLPRIVLSLQRELDFRFGGSSGTAPVPGRVSGRPPELPRRVSGSSGRCVGDDFRPKIGPGSSNSEEKSIPRVDFGSKPGLSECQSCQKRDFGVERRREPLFGSGKKEQGVARIERFRKLGAVAHKFAQGFHVRSLRAATLSLATRKMRCHLFSRVGACGRRPLESADPGVRRVGAFGTESNAGLGLGKLYGGRGLGTKVATRCQLWCPESVVL